jgi:hypothetical protein
MAGIVIEVGLEASMVGPRTEGLAFGPALDAEGPGTFGDAGDADDADPAADGGGLGALSCAETATPIAVPPPITSTAAAAVAMRPRRLPPVILSISRIGV